MKRQTAARIALWERRLDAIRPAEDGPSRVLLAHARQEWAHGHYLQVLDDLARLAAMWPKPHPAEWENP